MKENELYPIGSLIVLKNASRPIMISALTYKKDDIKYDYLGIPYPIGYMSEELLTAFNKEDIKEVQFIGFQDAESNNYLKEHNNKN